MIEREAPGSSRRSGGRATRGRGFGMLSGRRGPGRALICNLPGSRAALEGLDIVLPVAPTPSTSSPAATRTDVGRIPQK